jgi:hypothetical protein
LSRRPAVGVFSMVRSPLWESGTIACYSEKWNIRTK